MRALLQSALAGSSRQTIQATETVTPVDDLTTRLQEGEVERRLLLAA